MWISGWWRHHFQTTVQLMDVHFVLTCTCTRLVHSALHGLGMDVRSKMLHYHSHCAPHTKTIPVHACHAYVCTYWYGNVVHVYTLLFGSLLESTGMMHSSSRTNARTDSASRWMSADCELLQSGTWWIGLMMTTRQQLLCQNMRYRMLCPICTK